MKIYFNANLKRFMESLNHENLELYETFQETGGVQIEDLYEVTRSKMHAS